MFCHKCGNKSPEGAGFCHKCGAKLATANTATQAPETTAPTVASFAPQSQEVSAPSPVAAIATAPPPPAHSPIAATGFKEFVDEHIRATTKYQSVADLLENGKPSKLILLAAVPGLILTLYSLSQSPNVIAGIAIFVFFFVILCTYPLKFAVYVNKQGLAKKFNINADKRIDTNDFLLFLNNNMKHLSADMDEWIASQTQKTPIGTEITEVASYMSKSKGMADITLPHENAAIKQFEFNVSKGGKGDALSIWSFIFLPVYLYNLVLEMFNVGTGEYSIFYKSAPILSGAVKYYLINK